MRLGLETTFESRRPMAGSDRSFPAQPSGDLPPRRGLFRKSSADWSAASFSCIKNASGSSLDSRTLARFASQFA